MSEIVPAFEKLRVAGKTRHLGFTAKGDADDLHALAHPAFDGAQIFYNLLVPSAGEHIPDNYPCDDGIAGSGPQVSSIGVRVLAGGAPGREERHPLGSQNVAPIGSDTDYATGVHLPFSRLSQTRCRTLPELACARHLASNASTVDWHRNQNSYNAPPYVEKARSHPRSCRGSGTSKAVSLAG